MMILIFILCAVTYLFVGVGVTSVAITVFDYPSDTGFVIYCILFWPFNVICLFLLAMARLTKFLVAELTGKKEG